MHNQSCLTLLQGLAGALARCKPYFIVEVTVEFTMKKGYKGCSTTDGVVVVSLSASKAASSQFIVTILPTELPDEYGESHRAKKDKDFSSSPVVVMFDPGDTMKSGNVTLLSNPKTARLLFELQLSLPTYQSNNVTVNIMEEIATATIMC